MKLHALSASLCRPGSILLEILGRSFNHLSVYEQTASHIGVIVYMKLVCVDHFGLNSNPYKSEAHGYSVVESVCDAVPISALTASLTGIFGHLRNHTRFLQASPLCAASTYTDLWTLSETLLRSSSDVTPPVLLGQTASGLAVSEYKVPLT